MAVRDLEADTPWGDAIRWRYRHLLVDEAQNLNPIQYRFLELVAGSRNDLYLVGDPARPSTASTGRIPSFLAGLADRLGGVEVVRLPTNHRCTPQIVAAGAHVLGATDNTSSSVSSRRGANGSGRRCRRRGSRGGMLVVAFIRSLDPGAIRGRFPGGPRPHQSPAGGGSTTACRQPTFRCVVAASRKGRHSRVPYARQRSCRPRPAFASGPTTPTRVATRLAMTRRPTSGSLQWPCWSSYGSSRAVRRGAALVDRLDSTRSRTHERSGGVDLLTFPAKGRGGRRSSVLRG